MSDESGKSARIGFARRLRELRVIRGFKTARSLAHALEIDENRYTRYERAEVEPSLDLINRICTILDVRPDDLLAAGGGGVAQPGLAEGRSVWKGASPPAHAVPESARPIGLSREQQADALRWLIARELAALAPDKGPGLQQAAAIWARLDRPFLGIAQILSELAIDVDASVLAADRLRTLIDQLAHVLGGSVEVTPPHRSRESGPGAGL